MNKLVLKSVIIFFVFLSSATFATSLSFSLGRQADEAMGIESRMINKKKIFILSYRSPRHGVFTKAIPKDLFNSLYLDAKKWEAKINQKSGSRAIASFACNNHVGMNLDKKEKPLCLDSLPRAERRKFISWYNQQAQIAMPFYKN